MAERHFDFFENIDLEGISHAREIIEQGFIDHKNALEEDFNLHIDESIEYGTYTPEEGQEHKRIHHNLLWGIKIEP